MVVPVMMVRFVAEQERTEKIDPQAQGRDGNRLIELDREGMQQAARCLEGNVDGHARQDQRAGVAVQWADFSGSGGKTRVVSVPPGIDVGEGRDAEGHDVGTHVPAVRKQGHRVQEVAGDNFQEHHDGSQAGHEQGAPFPCRAAGREAVLMLPGR